LGCVYTLPENSLYSSINAFLDIENELVNFIEKDMKCALVGDFNAKTGFFEDFLHS
jgi:23S rRNA G2069 N7-methylase RlmK/C1962 C5-methylase RlmI